MAKDFKPHEQPPATMGQPQPSPEMVTVPKSTLDQLLARVESLERTAALSAEMADKKAKVILDQAFEQWKKEAARPAQDRTQDIANAQYGLTMPRFKVYLDSTQPDGKKGPDIKEHPVLEISANSDLEAQARYLNLCGIRKHDYKLVAQPVAA